MSRSEAKKKRMKRSQEGGRNPELNRLTWNGVRPVEKTTPTLSESKRKSETKHKRQWNPFHDGDRIPFLLSVS